VPAFLSPFQGKFSGGGEEKKKNRGTVQMRRASKEGREGGVFVRAIKHCFALLGQKGGEKGKKGGFQGRLFQKGKEESEFLVLEAKKESIEAYCRKRERMKAWRDFSKAKMLPQEETSPRGKRPHFTVILRRRGRVKQGGMQLCSKGGKKTF